MIPSNRLVLLALAPLAVSVAAVLSPALVRPMLGLDALIALLAALDAFLARGRLVRVEREVPKVLSVGRDNAVKLHVRSLTSRSLTVSVTDDLPVEATAPDLPATVELRGRGRASVTYHVRPSLRGAYVLGAHHVRYPSPLGLWQRQLRLPAEDPVKVYPDV